MPKQTSVDPDEMLLYVAFIWVYTVCYRMENVQFLGDFFQPRYTELERTSYDFPFRASVLFMKFPNRECMQGSHRLEKYLNLKGFLEKSLKIYMP